MRRTRPCGPRPRKRTSEKSSTAQHAYPYEVAKVTKCAAHAMGRAGSTQWHRQNTKWRLQNMHAKAARARVSFREARKRIAHNEKI